MKIILSESYMSLGEAGDVVEVKPGYARNFLIPQKIGVTATGANLRRFQDKAKELQTKKERERDNSKKTLGALADLKLTVQKTTSDEGKLFGSVTTKELEAEFLKKGVQVDRRQIVLGQQIKMVGEYQIMVKLVGGMKAMVPLEIESDDPKKAAAMKAVKEAIRVEEERRANTKDEEVVAAPAATTGEDGEALSADAASTDEATEAKAEKKPKKKSKKSDADTSDTN